MKTQLEQLCTALEEELERQQNVLSVCVAQGQAARAHDLEMLEVKTLSLNRLLTDFVDGERKRADRTVAAARALGLDGDELRLSELIDVAPEPWKGRLTRTRKRLRTTLTKTRQTVLDNNAVIRRSLSVVSDALESLVDCFPAAPHAGGYTARGMGRAPRVAQASVLDHRG